MRVLVSSGDKVLQQREVVVDDHVGVGRAEGERVVGVEAAAVAVSPEQVVKHVAQLCSELGALRVKTTSDDRIKNLKADTVRKPFTQPLLPVTIVYNRR